MKELFLDTLNGLVDTHECFRTINDVQAKYNQKIYAISEEDDKFILKIICIHNERPTMKGRGPHGECY